MKDYVYVPILLFVFWSALVLGWAIWAGYQETAFGRDCIDAGGMFVRGQCIRCPAVQP